MKKNMETIKSSVSKKDFVGDKLAGVHEIHVHQVKHKEKLPKVHGEMLNRDKTDRRNTKVAMNKADQEFTADQYEKISTRFRKESRPHMLVEELHEHLHKLDMRELKDLRHGLIRLSRQFVSGHLNLKEYKQEVLETLKKEKAHFKGALHRGPRTILEHISEAFRCMFNLMDHMISAVRKSERTMAETRTPGACLFGRTHFFNKIDSDLGKKLKEFEASLKEMKGVGQTSEKKNIQSR